MLRQQLEGELSTGISREASLPIPRAETPPRLHEPAQIVPSQASSQAFHMVEGRIPGSPRKSRTPRASRPYGSWRMPRPGNLDDSPLGRFDMNFSFSERPGRMPQVRVRSLGHQEPREQEISPGMRLSNTGLNRVRYFRGHGSAQHIGAGLDPRVGWSRHRERRHGGDGVGDWGFFISRPGLSKQSPPPSHDRAW